MRSKRTASRRLGAFIVAASAALSFAAAADAAPARKGAPAAAQSGLAGIWLLDQHTYDVQDDLTRFSPPYNDKIRDAAMAAQRRVREGGKVVSDNNRLCLPVGMPVMVTNEFALKFIVGPDEITQLNEQSTIPRTFYLNKKTHPTDIEPSWNGHSIAHWEGKTLVVDTTNLNDRTPHIAWVREITSTTTHIIERYHVENNGELLVNDITFIDPNILSKPWTVSYKYHRAPKGTELWEYVCEVNAPGWSERFAGDPQYQAAKAAGPQPGQ